MICETETKNAAFVYADLEQNVLGLRSRLADELGGVPVLRRTVNRLERAQQLDAVYVFCPQTQQAAVGSLLQNTVAIVVGLTEPVEPSTWLKRRKWSLASWRGGLGEATVFDELPASAEMVRALTQQSVQVAVAVPAGAVYVDPVLMDGLLEQHHEHRDDMRFTFAHTAPGLTGCAFRIDLLGDLVAARTTIGQLLAYNPDAPRGDFINHPCTYRTPETLNASRFRYLADTQRSWDALAAAIGTQNGASLNWDAAGVVKRVEESKIAAAALPEELEIELITEPSRRMQGYPHCRPPRPVAPMAPALFEKILADCAGYDDICLTLGGIGEPLLHPQLPELLQIARQAGIFGIHVETDGWHLHGAMAEALLESGIDILSVHLDANTSEIYQDQKGEDAFETVAGHLEQFLEKSKTSGGPLVVPQFVKTRRTFPDMESFFMRWLRAGAFPVVTGYNDFAGQIADQAIMDMSPPHRRPCYRLFRQLTIRADGQVDLCGQDIHGRHPLGNVNTASLRDLWQSPQLKQVRRQHRERRFGEHPLCGACKEWHR